MYYVKNDIFISLVDFCSSYTKLPSEVLQIFQLELDCSVDAENFTAVSLYIKNLK